jgi:hypothetical protein
VALSGGGWAGAPGGRGNPRRGESEGHAAEEERGRPDEAGIQLPKRESTAIRPLTLDGAHIKAWRVGPEGIWVPPANALAGSPRHARLRLAWLISHQPAVLFSHNKPAISNQPAVLFSHNKSAPAISHQPTEQAAGSRLSSTPPCPAAAPRIRKPGEAIGRGSWNRCGPDRTGPKTVPVI